jgi:hypothetical protein
MISVNGCLINALERGKLPLARNVEPPMVDRFYGATERGRACKSAYQDATGLRLESPATDV